MGPLTPDVADLIVAILAFAFVFAIVGGVLIPRITKVLADRHDALEGGFDRVGRLEEEIREAKAELVRETADARREAARIRQDAVDEGAEAVAEARGEAGRVRDELVAAGRTAIAAERAAAEVVLHAEIGIIATELAAKIIGEQLGEFTASGDTVTRFLAEVEARDAAKSGAAEAADA
ncbi:F0F1 ATP synthase subunit B family protein [Yinghuangia soli]|uniref:ATP synthase subunit b n=1 Tax=Yinghuangia soli TaxID=2908204 RepID=A0AA41PXB9_9ACTN|nr:hypothetical protein [Yinghuangia soli]MCF2527287.1 hypothetical protein [Yinghuangia soli]